MTAGRVCALLTAFMVIFASPVLAAPPFPADGDYRYLVKRNNEPIGTLKLNIKRDGMRLVATIDYLIEIRVMSLVFYRYTKKSREVFDKGLTVAYEADINDNGKESRVTAERNSDRLSITHPGGNTTAPVGTLVSNYWPRATVERTTLIDSSDGVLRTVKVAPPVAESLGVDDRKVDAMRYAMTGDLERTLWYGAKDGLWLKIKFKASDGSDIEIERDWPPFWKRGLL